MVTRVRLHHAEIDYLLSSPSGPVVRKFLDYGEKVEIAAKAKAPHASGEGAESIGMSITYGAKRFTIKIGTNRTYMLYQHEGTGIYGSRGRPITPTTHPYLVFFPKGGTHWIRTKQVLGVKPNPFLVDALRENVPFPIRRYHF